MHVRVRPIVAAFRVGGGLAGTEDTAGLGACALARRRRPASETRPTNRPRGARQKTWLSPSARSGFGACPAVSLVVDCGSLESVADRCSSCSARARANCSAFAPLSSRQLSPSSGACCSSAVTAMDPAPASSGLSLCDPNAKGSGPGARQTPRRLLVRRAGARARGTARRRFFVPWDRQPCARGRAGGRAAMSVPLRGLFDGFGSRTTAQDALQCLSPRARGATSRRTPLGHAPSGDLTDLIVPSGGRVVPIAVGRRNR
jgi:hypothetical protein